jgi:hypothetical protein
MGITFTHGANVAITPDLADAVIRCRARARRAGETIWLIATPAKSGVGDDYTHLRESVLERDGIRDDQRIIGGATCAGALAFMPKGVR